MTIQERDDAATHLDSSGRDRLQRPQLRAVLDPFDEDWLAIDDPGSSNEEEWLESDSWHDLEGWR